MRVPIPASSGLFALNWEISVCVRLRGGAGRTRTSNQTIISSWLAKCLKCRSLCVRAFVSANSRLNINETVSAPSSLLEQLCSLNRERRWTRWIRICGLARRKAEHLVLARPLRWQVAEASNAHAVGEPTIDGRLDEIGRKESKLDCHVDLSRAAVFSLGDAVYTCR